MTLRHISKSALLLGIALGGCSHTSDLLTGITGKDEPAAETAAAPNYLGANAAQMGANAAELGEAVRQAQLQRRAGDLNGATQTLSQLVLIAPDDPRVLGEYGKTLLDKGEVPDALAFLQRAGELAPTDWAIFSALGVAYSRSANYQGARAAFTRALLLKPGDPTVLNNFAMTQIQAGDLAGAEALLTQAGINAADDPRIAENLALVRQLKAAGGTAPATVASRAPAQLTPPAPVAAAPAPASPVVAAAPPADVTGATLETARPVRAAELPVIRSTPVGPSGPVRAAAPAPAAPRAATPAPAAASVAIVPGRSTYVQVAAYNTEGKASELVGRLGGLAPKIMSGTANGQTFYRVRIGPLANSAEAASTLARVKALGFTDARYVSEAAAPAATSAPVATAPRSGAPALRLSENAREPQ